MNMDILVVGTLDRLLIRSYYIKFDFRKNKLVYGKTLFCVIGSFGNPILFALTLAFNGAFWYGNVTFSIVVLSTKKLYSSLSVKVPVFQKDFFKVKVLKMFKNPNDCLIKI